jgi:regulator of replication initiation timing
MGAYLSYLNSQIDTLNRDIGILKEKKATLNTTLDAENVKYKNLLSTETEYNTDIAYNTKYYNDLRIALNSSLDNLTNIYNQLQKNLAGYIQISDNDTKLSVSYTNAIIPYLQSENRNSFSANIDNLNMFYQSIAYENDKLNNRYNYIKNQFVRHDQIDNNYSESIVNMNVVYNIFFYFFYILVLVYVIVLYLYKPNWSIYFRIFIIILFASYPFVIFKVETFIHNLWIMIYSMLTGSVYNNLTYSQKVVLNNTTDLTTGDY